MKTFFKALFNLITPEKKMVLAVPRFSYIDNVLDEEYNDHVPYIDPVLKPSRLELTLDMAKSFLSGLLFRMLTFTLFVLYYLVHTSLKAVRFIR